MKAGVKRENKKSEETSVTVHKMQEFFFLKILILPPSILRLVYGKA